MAGFWNFIGLPNRTDIQNLLSKAAEQDIKIFELEQKQVECRQALQHIEEAITSITTTMQKTQETAIKNTIGDTVEAVLTKSAETKSVLQSAVQTFEGQFTEHDAKTNQLQQTQIEHDQKLHDIESNLLSAFNALRETQTLSEKAVVERVVASITTETGEINSFLNSVMDRLRDQTLQLRKDNASSEERLHLLQTELQDHEHLLKLIIAAMLPDEIETFLDSNAPVKKKR